MVVVTFASTACSPVVIDEREVCGTGEVTVFAEGATFPFSALALDATHVYWSSADGIMVAPKSGGPPAVFADHFSEVFWIAVDANNVYAHGQPDQGVPGIYSLGKAGNTSPKLLAETVVVTHAVLDGDRVYWSAPGLSFVPKAGGASTLLYNKEISTFALDQERAYVVDRSTTDAAIVSVPKLAPLPSQKLPHIVELTDGDTPVVADGERLYYWTGSDIVSVPNVGGDPSLLVPEADRMGSLRVDPECLFWTIGLTSEPDRTKLRAARRGGEVVTVSASHGFVRSLVADRSGVYWLDTDKAAIMRLSR
jgi:hypothetical protein